MIYSPGRRYIFIHQPKTGGTAMALALESRAMKDDMMLGDTPKALRRRHKLRDAKAAGRLWKHATLADLDGLITPAMIAPCFVFTLVRNPWDRAVSYYHWLSEQSFDHPAVQLAKRNGFKDFICTPAIIESLKQSPARSYVTDASGTERCDLYLRLEAFAQDAAPLFAHLGFSFDLPRVNASARDRSFQSYYDTQSRAAVAQACAEDIERFGYSFDDAEVQLR